MSGIEVIVAVDAKSERDFAALAATAESVGLRINANGRLFAAGVLAGVIEQASIARLEKVPGVVSVEKSRKYKLPPEGQPQ